MANQLRDTQDPQYNDPYGLDQTGGWSRGRGFTTMLNEEHRKRFPESSLRWKAQTFGYLFAALAMMTIWSLDSQKVRHQDHAQKMQDSGR